MPKWDHTLFSLSKIKGTARMSVYFCYRRTAIIRSTLGRPLVAKIHRHPCPILDVQEIQMEKRMIQNDLFNR